MFTKKIVGLIWIILLPSILAGQKVKLKENKYYKSKITKEAYFVLKKNEYYKEGEYKAYYKNAQLKEVGIYHNNKKDGAWKEFNNNGELRRLTTYENGKKITDKKIGIWREYYENGQVVIAYDYDQDKALQPLINVQIRYPSTARENELEGMVEVLLKFSENCDIEELKVIKSLSEECDEEALKGVEKLAELIKQYDQERCSNEGEVISIEFKLE